jgi:hypothetical protein
MVRSLDSPVGFAYKGPNGALVISGHHAVWRSLGTKSIDGRRRTVGVAHDVNSLGVGQGHCESPVAVGCYDPASAAPGRRVGSLDEETAQAPLPRREDTAPSAAPEDDREATSPGEERFPSPSGLNDRDRAFPRFLHRGQGPSGSSLVPDGSSQAPTLARRRSGCPVPEKVRQPLWRVCRFRRMTYVTAPTAPEAANKTRPVKPTGGPACAGHEQTSPRAQLQEGL